LNLTRSQLVPEDATKMPLYDDRAAANSEVAKKG
jgi:hypothetical protein